jgi:hypothetical protein
LRLAWMFAYRPCFLVVAIIIFEIALQI